MTKIDEVVQVHGIVGKVKSVPFGSTYLNFASELPMIESITIESKNTGAKTPFNEMLRLEDIQI